jgi:hypothetical protein
MFHATLTHIELQIYDLKADIGVWLGRVRRSGRSGARAGPALGRPGQITSRRLVRAIPPATRATV